jgi:hypothetical protein
MRLTKFLSKFGVFCCTFVAVATAQERIPATPLITHDPYFSVWSFTDALTDSDTTHWTGKPQPLTGIARIDGKPFRFMGKRPDSIPPIEQIEKTVEATHTRYRFRASGVELEFSFFTPVMMDDLDLFSRPVTYLTWKVNATDGLKHQVSIALDVDPVISVNDRTEQVVPSRHQTASLNMVSVGSRDQNVLNRSGDDLRIDWGYFHLVLPRNERGRLAIASQSAESFATGGTLPASDSIEMPQQAGHSNPHLAAQLDFDPVTRDAQSRHLLVSYTEGYAIQYLHRNLRPFWQRNEIKAEDMLERAESQFLFLETRGNAFDAELKSDLTKAGGERYAAIALLSYRQTIAAHKLVADINGDPMLFAKENFSNG